MNIQPVDPNFEYQLRQLRAIAQQNATAFRSGGMTVWYRPDGYYQQNRFVPAGADPTDPDEPARLFNRDVANASAVTAVADATRPGTVGDLVVSGLQADYLACWERAYRLRHQTPWPRMLIHASGRLYGLGDARGPWGWSVLELTRRLAADAVSGQETVS